MSILIVQQNIELKWYFKMFFTRCCITNRKVGSQAAITFDNIFLKPSFDFHSF